jgi:NADPH:quinone reductase-like Zn-dependent oxidoreductase
MVAPASGITDVGAAAAVPAADVCDVVLNTLTSPGMVAASLATLCAGGRFVEISKRDIWSAARVTTERPDVGFNFFALDFLPPPALRTALARVATVLAAGRIVPLRGVVYGLADASLALRLMAQVRTFQEEKSKVTPGAVGCKATAATEPLPGRVS